MEMPKTENMAKQRILRELSTPNMNQQSLCIEFLNINVAFKLKSGLIYLLFIFFCGLVSEDPSNYFKEFHVISGLLNHESARSNK
jgi:hypothetical protein